MSGLIKDVVTVKTLLPALGFAAAQVPNGFFASANGFYFNARTRALANVGYWASAGVGSLVMAVCCDSPRLGHRQRRGLIAGCVVAIVIIAVWSGMLYFVTSYDLDRSKPSPRVDWADRPDSRSVAPLVILLLSGLIPGVNSSYTQWLASTYSNDPAVISRLMGYVEALRGLGQAILFALDSHKVAYRTEGILLFVWMLYGVVSCLVATALYTKDTVYGMEESVIVPEVFEKDRTRFVKVAGQNLEAADGDHHDGGSGSGSGSSSEEIVVATKSAL
jgi:hypothetical protein